MARALQCPDCGHREPLDNVSDVEQFRCHGCGRALKVPPEFRPPVAATAEAGEPTAGEPTAANPTAANSTTPLAAGSGNGRVLARATEGAPSAALTNDDIVAPSPSRVERAQQRAAAYDQKLPLAIRLLVWVVWLPIGLTFSYWLALKFDWINQDQLFDTVGEVTWSRFVPIARVLPLAAIVVAVLVHLTILGLEQWAGRRRLRRVPSTQPDAA